MDIHWMQGGDVNYQSSDLFALWPDQQDRHGRRQGHSRRHRRRKHSGRRGEEGRESQRPCMIVVHAGRRQTF